MEDFYHSTEFLEKSPNWYSTKENSHLTYSEMKVPQDRQALYTTQQAKPSNLCQDLCSEHVNTSAERGLGWTPTGEDNHLRATHSSEREKKVTGVSPLGGEEIN